MAHRTTKLTIQKWGNSLAVRIPVAIARGVHFHSGTVVELELHEGGVLVKATGHRKLTLNERLASLIQKSIMGRQWHSNLLDWKSLNDKNSRIPVRK